MLLLTLRTFSHKGPVCNATLYPSPEVTMKSLTRAFALGFLLWLIPFAVAIAIFPLKRSGSPLFDTVMSVVVVSAAILCITLYFAGRDGNLIRESLAVGLLWMVMSQVLDLSMFMWGPMKMPFAAYMADIGLAYVVYPIMTAGTGVLLQKRGPAIR
jgi:hypothetical protein